MTTTPSIRVTQYRIGPGEFTGAEYELELDRPLLPDYFVLINGTVQDLGGAVGPELTGVRVQADPFQSGGLSLSSGPDIINLARRTSGTPWEGTIQVVECERDHEGSGFRLLGVARLPLLSSTGVGIQTTRATLPIPFTDEDRGVLFGGPRAGGAAFSPPPSGSPNEQPSIQGRVYYDAGDLVIERYESAGADTNVRGAIFIVYAVQWGSDWTVQRVNATGPNSGRGSLGFDWNTTPINQVTRANTWLFGSAWTQNPGPAESAANLMIALGSGVLDLATETTVAANYRSPPGGSSAEIVVMSHPRLVVDWIRGTNEPTTDWLRGLAVTAPIVPETRLEAPLADGRDLSITTGRRLASAWINGQTTTLADYPITFWHPRHVTDTVLEVRRAWGLSGDWSYRIQSVDFGDAGVVADDVDAGSLQPESTDSPESTTGLVYIPDHPDQAVADLLLTLRKARITSLTRALASGAQEMEDQVFALLVDRDLGTATGAQLDQWGELVGEQRLGLDDEAYRRFIQARIKANRSGGSTDELIAIWELVTGPSRGVLESGVYPAGLQLAVFRDEPMTDDVVRRVVRIMQDTARPSGISIDLVEATTGYLGFIGNPDAFPLDIGTLARSLA